MTKYGTIDRRSSKRFKPSSSLNSLPNTGTSLLARSAEMLLPSIFSSARKNADVYVRTTQPFLNNPVS